MKKIYVTLIGGHAYYGFSFLKENAEVLLAKEHDNEYDNEAIAASIPGLGKIGYIANSVRTVKGECYSAGRLYDKFDEKVTAKVLLVAHNFAILSLDVIS